MVRGDKLIARTRDHSYSELQDTLSQVVPMGERFNRNVLFTCLGSPGKPVVDTAGPLLMQAGDKVLLCSDGLWGSVSDTVITEQLALRPISDAVPQPFFCRLNVLAGEPRPRAKSLCCCNSVLHPDACK
jgi:serine/threonine protein phosphatase PrpC